MLAPESAAHLATEALEDVTEVLQDVTEALQDAVEMTQGTVDTMQMVFSVLLLLLLLLLSRSVKSGSGDTALMTGDRQHVSLTWCCRDEAILLLSYYTDQFCQGH